MKYIILIHGAIEALAGFVLIFNPSLLLMAEDNTPQGIIVSKLYGIAALCMGVISFLIGKSFQFQLMYKQIILTIIAFHVAVGMYFYGLYNQAVVPNLGACVLHLGLAVGFVVVYMKDFQKFQLDSAVDKE